MIRGLLLVALVGYAASWLLQLRSFSRGDPSGNTPDRPRSSRSTSVAALAAGVHLLALVQYTIERDELPLSGFGPVAATLAFASVFVVLVLRGRLGHGPAGLFALPPAIALLGAAMLGGVQPATATPGVDRVWFAVHVGTLLAGYALLLVASVAGAMYLLQFRALKKKDFGNVFRSFPPLETLDRMTGIALIGGLTVLTIGLVVGITFVTGPERDFALTDPDVGFGLLSWVTYGLALALRRAPGARGERRAALAVLAFVVCATAFALLRLTSSNPELFL